VGVLPSPLNTEVQGVSPRQENTGSLRTLNCRSNCLVRSPPSC